MTPPTTPGTRQTNETGFIADLYQFIIEGVLLHLHITEGPSLLVHAHGRAAKIKAVLGSLQALPVHLDAGPSLLVHAHGRLILVPSAVVFSSSGPI